MPLVYTVDDIKITEYHVNLIDQVVMVQYYEMVGDETIKQSTAYFYVNLPEEPGLQDYQLPPAKIAELVSLRDDAEAAIATRLGV